MQILIKIVFIFLPIIGWGQIGFYKHYADNGYDFGQGIVQLEDSGYVVTGSSGSFTGNSQAFLMRTDSIGNWKWSTHYGGSETDWGRRVLYKKNVGFYICGYSNSFGNGDYDFYMVKTDEAGTEEWTKTYGGNEWDRAQDAIMTRDTGIVMVGETNNGVYGTDMMVVRTDKDGTVLWSYTFENYGNDIANAVDIYRDSIILVAGNHYYADSSQVKALVYMIKDNGVILDTLVYTGYHGDFELNDIMVTGDTIQGVGAQKSNSDDTWAVVYFRARMNGNNFFDVWLHIDNRDGDWHGDVCTAYDDETFRYLGISFENNANAYPGGRDIMVQKGNDFMFWEASAAFLAMEEPDVNGQIISTSDGGAILVGYHQNPLVGSGGATIFLYKIGPNEVYPSSLTPLTYSQVVGLKDEIADIEVSVYPNPADQLLNIDLPNSNAVSYRLADVSGKIIDSGSLIGSGSLNISGVPSGMYVLHLSNDSGNSIHRIIIQ